MTITTPTPPLVLVIAASDPTAGAGIQADTLTLASLGCHPLTALTAITVQDTVGVESVLPVAAETLERQARALLEDMQVAAFKVGVLGSVENVLAVAEIVSDYPDIPLILDPVLAAWAKKGKPEMYESGTWGPASADEMLARTGRSWRRP